MKERESNIEAARILAMILVVLLFMQTTFHWEALTEAI